MAAEVVHDDDVACLQRGNEHLLDIGAEALAVDRAVEDARCGEGVGAQGPEKGQGAPVAVRRKASQALALLSPAPKRGHVGLDPGLIDEDELVGVELLLPRSPALAAAGDVSSRLLEGEQRFF